MRLASFSGACDICGKPRGKPNNHDLCSKKRKARGLENQPSEAERLSLGRYAQKSYLTRSYNPPE